MRTSFNGCTWERCVSVGNAKGDAYVKTSLETGVVFPGSDAEKDIKAIEKEANL